MNGSNLQVFVAVYLPSPLAAGGHFSPGPGLVHSCSSKRNFLKVACKWQGACELGLAPLNFGSGHVSALCRDTGIFCLFLGCSLGDQGLWMRHHQECWACLAWLPHANSWFAFVVSLWGGL